MKREYDIAVTTEVWRSGCLWWDGGTMRWFGVSESVRSWLADSCRATAIWLLASPDATDGYSIRYRTIVTSGGEVVSDTTMVAFDGLRYCDVIAFQRWALQELSEMVDLFEIQHAGSETPRVGLWSRMVAFVRRVRGLTNARRPDPAAPAQADGGRQEVMEDRAALPTEQGRHGAADAVAGGASRPRGGLAIRQGQRATAAAEQH